MLFLFWQYFLTVTWVDLRLWGLVVQHIHFHVPKSGSWLCPLVVLATTLVNFISQNKSLSNGYKKKHTTHKFCNVDIVCIKKLTSIYKITSVLPLFVVDAVIFFRPARHAVELWGLGACDTSPGSQQGFDHLFVKHLFSLKIFFSNILTVWIVKSFFCQS